MHPILWCAQLAFDYNLAIMTSSEGFEGICSFGIMEIGTEETLLRQFWTTCEVAK